MAEFLPPLIVELRATITEFTAKMGEAKAQMEEVSTKGASTFEAMGAAGGVALAGIAVAAGAVGVSALHAADQFETAHARLQTAIANTGSSFDDYQGRIAAAEKTFEHLGYTHAEYENALGRMTAALGSTGKAMANMGTAANVAAMFHLSLERATTLVTKAAEGNSTALKRLGVDFQATGDKANDAAALMELLNQKFGGAAQAQAETFAGKLKALHATLGDVEVKIGQALIPVIESMASVIGDVVGWIEQHKTAAEALAAIIGGPLVLALGAYIAIQAKAFVLSVVNTIKGIASGLVELFIPAVEGATAATESFGIAEAVATGGLTLLAGLVTFGAMKLMEHATSSDSAATADGHLTAATGDVTGATQDWNNMLDASTTAVDNHQKEIAKLTGSMTDDMGAITGLISAQDGLARAQEHLTQLQKEGGASVKEHEGHVKDLETAEKSLKTTADALTSAIDRQATAHKKLDELLKPQTMRSVTEAGIAAHKANEAYGTATADVADKLQKYNDAVAQSGADSNDAAVAYTALTDAQDAQTLASFAQDDAMQGLADAQRTTIGTTDEIAAATKDAQTADDNVTTAINAHKDAQDHLNAVQNQSPVHTLATDTQDYNTALLAVVTNKDAVATAQGTINDLMQTGGTNLGVVRDHLQDMIDKEPGLRTILLPTLQKIQAALAPPPPPPPPPPSAPGIPLPPVPIWQIPAAPPGSWAPGPPLPPVPWSQVPKAPGFQHGGVVPGPIGAPVMATVHGGERVIPVGGGTGGGVTISVGDIVINGITDPDKVAEAVREKLLQMGRGLVGVGLS